MTYAGAPQYFSIAWTTSSRVAVLLFKPKTFIIRGLHQVDKFAGKFDFATVENKSRLPERLRDVYNVCLCNDRISWPEAQQSQHQ